MTYHDIPWNFLTNHGISWHIMIYHNIWHFCNTNQKNLFCRGNTQGPPKFSAESVIKNPNQTSLHFYRRSCHPFLRLSQTKYLYYTIFNTDELLMNIWRGPGNICSYGRVVKGSLSVFFMNVCNGLCAHGEESTIRLEREELSVYL